MKANIDFSHKKYLVTGSSSGLGRSIAIDLSQKGAQVVLTGRKENELQNTLKQLNGNNHFYLTCHLDELEDLSNFFDKIVNDGKKLDGVVHCAGIVPLTPINTLKRDKINQCMSINFYALLELVRCFSKSKYHSEKSSFVEISSISSVYPGKCQTLYAASKAAANASIQALALELVKKNIRINSVLPGIIDTPATHKAIQFIGKETHDRTLTNQLHGLIKMEEISDIVTFLLSDLSSTITGRTIYADGGYLDF